MIGLIWYVHSVPKAAKMLRKAKRKKLVTNVLHSDDGIARIVVTKKVTASVLENPDGTVGVLPAPISPLSSSNPDPKVTLELLNTKIKSLKTIEAKLKETGEDSNQVTSRITQLEQQHKIVKEAMTNPQKIRETQEEIKKIEKINDAVTKTFILESVGMPIVLQYLPKGIVMNAKTLAMVQNGEQLGIKLSPPEIKKYFTRMWANSRLAGLMDKKELVGFRKAKKMFGSLDKFMPIIIILGLGILLVILAYILLG